MTTLPELCSFFFVWRVPVAFSTFVRTHARCQVDSFPRSLSWQFLPVFSCRAAPVRTGKTGYIHEERSLDERILSTVLYDQIQSIVLLTRVEQLRRCKNAIIISYASLYFTPSITTRFTSLSLFITGVHDYISCTLIICLRKLLILYLE